MEPKGSYRLWCEKVEACLPSSLRHKVQGDWQITCLDFFTDGITPEEAAARLTKEAAVKA